MQDLFVIIYRLRDQVVYPHPNHHNPMTKRQTAIELVKANPGLTLSELNQISEFPIACELRMGVMNKSLTRTRKKTKRNPYLGNWIYQPISP